MESKTKQTKSTPRLQSHRFKLGFANLLLCTCVVIVFQGCDKPHSTAPSLSLASFSQTNLSSGSPDGTAAGANGSTTSTSSTPSSPSAGCVNPDTMVSEPTGSTYQFYVLPSGTPADCRSDQVIASCSGLGQWVPAIAAIRYSSCNVVATSVDTTAAPIATPNPMPTPAPTASNPSSSGSGCGGALVCDGFETVPSGGAPDSSIWSISMPDCSGSGQLSVDNQQAHSGQQSLRVEGGANYCDHIFLHFGKISELGAKFYIRFYVRLQNAFGNGHVTFLSMTDNSDSGKHFRMGGQSGVFMFNRELSDATLPVLSPTGISMSVSPASNQWYCVEFQIDEQAKALDTWINSILAAGLLIDQTPTPDIDQQWLSGSPWQPSLIDFNLGWESYGSMANTVWFDDIAISTQRIGCTP